MTQKHSEFRFENYNFDFDTGVLTLKYSHDGDRQYEERITFELPDDIDSINQKMIDALAFYIFIIAGSSYYKSFAPPKMNLGEYTLDYWQADFFNMIYRGGLSQFVYENKLSVGDIATFEGSEASIHHAQDYDGAGVLLMQSGGKDSLLSSELMKKAKNEFVSWHMSSTGKYPPVLDAVGRPVVVSKRSFDIDAIKRDWEDGAMNGHIPFSALYAGFALLQAVLLDKNLVIASNES